MTPLKDYRTHSIVISKFFQRGFFYSNPSFTVPRVRYIINTYSIVNVINQRRPYGTVLYGTPTKGLPHDF